MIHAAPPWGTVGGPRCPARLRRRVVRRAVAGLGCLLALAACGPFEPLTDPIDASLVIERGGHVAVSNQGLQQVSSAVRVAAGKSFVAPVAPLALKGPAAATLGALDVALSIADGAASVAQDAVIVLTYPVVIGSHALAVQPATGASCASAWAPSGLTLQLRLDLGRDAFDSVDIRLAGPPTLVGDGVGVPADACLDAAVGAAVDAHLRQAVLTAVASRYVDAARHALRAVFPPAWETALQARTGRQGRLQLQTRWRSAEADGPLLGHNGAYGAAALSIAFDGQRDPCALDAPPPPVVPSAMPVQMPLAPAGLAVLPRAWVLDASTLSRLGWALHRSGALCRSVGRGLESRLPAGWTGAVLPQLGGLVDASPVSAVFWPGTSPTVTLVDASGGGAALQLRTEKALLELVAPVDGVEMVVLRMRGTVRLRVTIVGSVDGIDLVVDDADAEDLAIDSPLAQVQAPDEAATRALLHGALAGIFETTLAFPSGPMAPPTLVGSSRTANALWLWMAGGAPAPAP